MKFHKLVAVVAIVSFGVQANAQTGGTMRDYDSSQGVVILNTNTNTNSNDVSSSATAVQQPVTVVEAAPAVESRADLMRKARQSAEVQTEQKIVEKLEESRLKEEQMRAERLFGNKIEATATATAVATPDGAAATATAVATPVVEPVKEEAAKEKATSVVIEKVEIVQPPAPVVQEPVIEAPVKETPVVVVPVAESKTSIEETKEKVADRIYIGAIAGAPSYNASNVKSNYALGFSVGSLIGENIGVEGSFLYSNHSVDTFWIDPIYKELDQYDFSAAARYYFMKNRIKPYVGGSVTYIYRKYQDRVRYGSPWLVNSSDEVEESHSVNLGLQAGVDFALNERILLGGGLDWNFNMMNKNDFNSSTYGNAVADSKPLEEINYSVVKLTAKFLF